MNYRGGICLLLLTVFACTKKDRDFSNTGSVGAGPGGSDAGAGDSSVGGNTTGGTAGSSGNAGAGAAGGSEGSGGTAGTGGANMSGAGGVGAAGTGGVAGSSGSGGTGGTAGTGGVGGVGAAGAGGSAGSSGGVGGSGPSYGMLGQSCTGLATVCQGESCCRSTLVPAGTYPMGRGAGGSDAAAAGNADEQPEHDVTVSAFSLDKYEVTVGRFRRFVDAFDGTPPPAGAGGHALIAGTGWQTPWDVTLPENRLALAQNLKCNPTSQTWTDAVGSNEAKAQNCVSWYEAFAFCAWDGGRLPTEAEWEYAAAGGDENRLYPWGAAGPNCTYANYFGCAGAVELVGNHPAGLGRWGQADLSGNVWEWTYDWYAAGWYTGGGDPCIDCANSTAGQYRVHKGAGYSSNPAFLRAAFRSSVTFEPVSRSQPIGFRCATSTQ